MNRKTHCLHPRTNTRNQKKTHQAAKLQLSTKMYNENVKNFSDFPYFGEIHYRLPVFHPFLKSNFAGGNTGITGITVTG